MSFESTSLISTVRIQSEIGLKTVNAVHEGWGDTMMKRKDDSNYDPLREFYSTVMAAYAKLTVDLGQVMASQQKPQA